MSIGEVKAALDEARDLLDQGRTTIESCRRRVKTDPVVPGGFQGGFELSSQR
ncbi:hypothetical protein ACLQ25_15230 [Micromonospora sp. DT44]|uniref:hypothetical protein n=1 Tax=Micromonospora sp. DT44 TaxID=3393439 RepID=UPI003CECBAAD